jgi:FAD/FMN-containing dehydrogenase
LPGIPIFVVIPNEVRNLSGFEIRKKEGFLTRRSGFGMMVFWIFLHSHHPSARIAASAKFAIMILSDASGRVGVHPVYETSAINPAYLEDASGFRGHAERLFLPENEQDVAEVLRRATRDAIPVTLSGAGTGVTGGRVPQGGWLLSLEKFSRLEIKQGTAFAGAGILLRDLQAAAAATRQFYAPDPTEMTACVGGTIGTNASGSRSFKYGATRRHVLGLRVVLASGEILHVRRGQAAGFAVPSISIPRSTKHAAGYILAAGMDWVDLFVGSEGTLGVVTEAELRLLSAPEAVLGGVIFFANDADALDAVDDWRANATPRMIEYFDRPSLDLLRGRFPEIPSKAAAALLVEQELESEDDPETSRWLARIERTKALVDGSWFGTSNADRERFRLFRHALPELVNETLRLRGCLKMGSDCAVPVERNREMLDFYCARLDEKFRGRYVIFGHIGDAHLHVNILPAKEESAEAAEVLLDFARKAVEFGGSVSAEHGLGKRKAHLLAIQYSPEEIEAMKAVKRRLDPSWILGRGTLFPEQAS